MPIYMDRHDVGVNVTAENVAHFHQEDLKVQHLFGCKGMTYWFDDHRKTGFCLIEAPDMESVMKMHDYSHGEVPNQVIEVDAAIVESFLGRIEDPKNTRNTELNIIDEPGFRTIMAIRLQRPPLKTGDTEPFRPSLHERQEAILEILGKHRGSLVKQTDSQALISFISVTDAVDAALGIRQLFDHAPEDKGLKPSPLKIGLSAGAPVTEKKSIFEDCIRLAERMCSIVKGDIVVCSEVKAAYDSGKKDHLQQQGHALVALTPSEEAFLTQLMDYTESAWSNIHFKVDDFSKPLGCSKSQLYRKMISLTGKSPNSFIREYRLEQAVNLLARQAGNISEIAFETGFSSPSYFSKCFQKKYGHQPSQVLN